MIIQVLCFGWLTTFVSWTLAKSEFFWGRGNEFMATLGMSSCQPQSVVELLFLWKQNYIKMRKFQTVGPLPPPPSRVSLAPGPPPTTKIEAPVPKFYKTEAPKWQF